MAGDDFISRPALALKRHFSLPAGVTANSVPSNVA
jgi:hypothetical protein